MYLDKRLKPYVNAFVRDAKDHGIVVTLPKRINISWGWIFPDKVVGICEKTVSIISIEESFWNAANPRLKRWVIYHEMGHWIGLDHDEDELAIMHHTVPDDDILVKLPWKKLVHQMMEKKQ
jgi:hypothetical protein